MQQLDGKRWTSSLSKLGDKGQVYMYDVVWLPREKYSRCFHANIFLIHQRDIGPFQSNPNIDLVMSQNVAYKIQRTKVSQRVEGSNRFSLNIMD